MIVRDKYNIKKNTYATDNKFRERASAYQHAEE